MSATCYTRRIDEAEFDDLEQQLRGLDPDKTFIFGNLDYGIHFHHHFFPAQKERGFGRTLFYVGDGSNWSNKSTELGLIMFGEVCPMSMGTQLSAKGNHYIGGENPKFITDRSSVKDVLALRAPTFAPDFIQHAFTNQLALLEEIMDKDAKERATASATRFHITGFLGSASPETGVDDKSLLKVTLGLKYEVPPSAKANVKADYSGKPKKRNLLLSTSSSTSAVPDDSDLQAVDDALLVSESDTLSDISSLPGHELGSPPHRITPTPTIALGAYYPPSLLPDYGGSLFRHEHAKLVQLDVRDINGDLIPPWDMYSQLKPGTIVLVEATLVCWHISGGDNGPDKKIYQIQGHRLRVLSESDEPVEVRTKPVIPLRRTTASYKPNIDSELSPRKSASSSFNSFTSPSKKSKKL